MDGSTSKSPNKYGSAVLAFLKHIFFMVWDQEMVIIIFDYIYSFVLSFFLLIYLIIITFIIFIQSRS